MLVCFDAKIVYAQKISAAVHCEKVNLFALKKILGVEMRTPNDLVYGETNRYPLFVNSAVRCVRYCLKLTRMEASKLPMNEVKEIGPQMFVVSCINVDLVLYGCIKV